MTGTDASGMTGAVREALEDALAAARSRLDGEVASYIPELALADPEALGIAVVGTRGRSYEAGDSRAEFTIQSVSKPFVYALAIEKFGLDAVSARVGVEPSGEAFNEASFAPDGRPMNPMINAGAMVVASLMAGDTAEQKSTAIVDGLSAFAGRKLSVDDAVFASELATGDRNRELAAMAGDALASSVDVATGAYFRQCSASVTAFDVAVMAATLAGFGRNPLTGERVVSEAVARWTVSVMASCGMYDGSGEWLARVGLPAKSGVAGAIVAIDPGHFGIGTFAPPLDDKGNSVRGTALLETLSTEYGLHLFGHQGEYLSPVTSAVVGDDGTLRITLRGELGFAGAEDVLAALDEPAERILVDLTGVTLLKPAAARLFIAAVATGAAGDTPIELLDPSGLLGFD